jgi:hypothetical protein
MFGTNDQQLAVLRNMGFTSTIKGLRAVIGLRYNVIGYMDREKCRRKGVVSFVLRMGYRVLTTQQPVVVYESGSVNNGLKNKIQHSVDRGIGGSLGIVFGLGKKEMK